MTKDNIASIIKALKPLRPSRLEANKELIGKLTVLDMPGGSRTRKCVMVRCQCDCGNLTIVGLSDLKRLHTKSCGCGLVSRRRVHGEASSVDKKASREYSAWSRVMCQVNKSWNNFPTTRHVDYVCLRWVERDKGYLNFLEDMGRKPVKSRLTKHDKSAKYEKGNCYWRVSK